MTAESKGAARKDAPRRTIALERIYQAPVEDVWELWTTEDGLESWWGPEGFVVKVHALDLRPGGELRYAMTAVAAEQIEYLKRAGMPLTNEHRITFTEIVPLRRLAYTHVVDFVPGVQHYDVSTVVELHSSAQGVRMVLTIDAMHDDHWTRMAVMGWEQELGKLGRALQR
ncbi:MAG TPA: SRPBCC domain-containing protein [Myxococcales bacterium]|nr:SRPBCC domain-containing protein [Myxococcales bacterium]